MDVFKNINMQQGIASLAELTAVFGAAAFIMVGGVAMNAKDILKEAQDTQKIANVRQLAIALELYYADYGSYPEGDFSSALRQLSQGYLASLPTGSEQYGYQILDSGQHYLLRVRLENPSSPYMQASIGEAVQELDCKNSYYCVRM